MSKVSVDIEYIKSKLNDIGYEISDCVERENNGVNWQLKFSNSGAIVTIYDSNRTKNTVVNGKVDKDEKDSLKFIVDSLKAKELQIDPLNVEIVEMIRSRKEDYYYDFKQIPHGNNEDLLHDILCLSNNIENRDAYLVLGVTDDYKIIIQCAFQPHSIDNRPLIAIKKIIMQSAPSSDVIKFCFHKNQPPKFNFCVLH